MKTEEIFLSVLGLGILGAFVWAGVELLKHGFGFLGWMMIAVAGALLVLPRSTVS